MSFGYFSTLFLKIKSISLPAGNAWIINKPRFRKFSMEKQTSNFSLIFSNSPQMFFTLQRLSWKALILSDASSKQNKLYLNIWKTLCYSCSARAFTWKQQCCNGDCQKRQTNFFCKMKKTPTIRIVLILGGGFFIDLEILKKSKRNLSDCLVHARLRNSFHFLEAPMMPDFCLALFLQNFKAESPANKMP